jgi:hypothetical protein
MNHHHTSRTPIQRSPVLDLTRALWRAESKKENFLLARTSVVGDPQPARLMSALPPGAADFAAPQRVYRTRRGRPTAADAMGAAATRALGRGSRGPVASANARLFPASQYRLAVHREPRPIGERPSANWHGRCMAHTARSAKPATRLGVGPGLFLGPVGCGWGRLTLAMPAVMMA